MANEWGGSVLTVFPSCDRNRRIKNYGRNKIDDPITIRPY